MGLFSDNKKKTATKATKKVVKKVSGRVDGVLKAPWMSEKALIGTERGVYVFAVPPEVTKTQVKAAVETLYKVTPTKVAIVNLPGKKKALRTRRGFGTRARRHKAYVYLKKGDTITLA
ncbi:50S ribosomal protein L23 [Patescibacteria group bacterium]|nr:50S ribosomal protein L23 [Patescibacteria group bacterium]